MDSRFVKVEIYSLLLSSLDAFLIEVGTKEKKRNQVQCIHSSCPFKLVKRGKLVFINHLGKLLDQNS